MSTVTNEQLATMIANGFASVDERFEEATKERQEMKEEIRVLTGRVDIIDDKVDVLDQRVNVLDGKFDAFTGTISNMKKRLTKVENDVYELKKAS